uniref:Uncharacterized protein n=1 Tax=Anopheles albimanus TaxID=7167 RepID=A0A182FXV2_ANOAL
MSSCVPDKAAKRQHIGNLRKHTTIMHRIGIRSRRKTKTLQLTPIVHQRNGKHSKESQGAVQRCINIHRRPGKQMPLPQRRWGCARARSTHATVLLLRTRAASRCFDSETSQPDEIS